MDWWELRAAEIERMDTGTLITAYKDGMRHCFNRVFGRNARQEQDLLGGTLLRRGVHSIPDIFGALEVSNRWSKGA